MSIPLSWFLVLAAALFSIGLYGVLSRRNAIGILMGIELMLNGVNVNTVALWRYVTPPAGSDAATGFGVDGQVFAMMVIALAAAEAAVGLALIISIYRARQTVELEDFSLMRG